MPAVQNCRFLLPLFFFLTAGNVQGFGAPADEADRLPTAILAAQRLRDAHLPVELHAAIALAKALLAREHFSDARTAAIAADLDALAEPQHLSEPLPPASSEASPALQKVGIGRMLETADQIVPLVTKSAGFLPEAFDISSIPKMTVGLVPKVLDTLGVVPLDPSGDVTDMRQRYPALENDQLANKYIERACWYAAGSAAAVTAVRSKFGPKGQIAGLTSEAAIVLGINANLVTHLASLYGLNLSDMDQPLALAAVIVAARGATKYNLPDSPVLDTIGQNLGDALTSGKVSTTRFFSRFVSSDRPAATVRLAPREKGSGETLTTDPPPTDPAPADGTADESSPEALGGAVALVLAQSALSGAEAWGSTWAVGFAAKKIFRAANRTVRAQQNDGFRRFMMTEGGDGFLKMLIVSLVASDHPPVRLDFSPGNPSRKIQFIRSLMRSALICSPDDLSLLSSSSSGLPPQKREILAAACRVGVTEGRYALMKSELSNFTTIPQSFVLALRTAARSDRFHMAEVLMQLQLVDGYQDPLATEYYNASVTKVLGLETPADLAYVGRLRSTIVNGGGLVESETSPTGFVIRGSGKSPYGVKTGYSLLNGPDIPSLPLVAKPPIPPPKAPVISTIPGDAPAPHGTLPIVP